MEGVQPSQPQKKKPSHPEAVAQSLLVVRGDDKAAQDEEKIDEKPGVAQERHSVQMAVGVQMEQGHQARSDSAPAVQYHESFHVRPERVVCLGLAAHSDVQTIRLRWWATITRRSSTALRLSARHSNTLLSLRTAAMISGGLKDAWETQVTVAAPYRSSLREVRT